MDGIIVIKKELNMTSHDVVSKMRKILKTKKIGHIGTLDPLATGVLVTLVGEATKIAPFIENVEKTYIAKICVGKITSTLDEEGEVLEEKEVQANSILNIDDVLNSFLGESYQIPPMYSAIKVNGKHLYDYARENKEVEIKQRKIFISSIRRVSELEFIDGCLFFSFEVTVSKGTYIRTLCKDIALKLGFPGYMKELVRTKSGNFKIEETNTLSELESGHYKLISLLDAISFMNKTENLYFINKASHGMKISKNDVLKEFGSLVEQFCVSDGYKLIAIYSISELCYKVDRVWN